MADDSQIRIGLSIDTSGLDAAQGAAQQSATAIAAAYDRVTIAAKNSAQAQAKLGAAAVANLPQSAQAAAILDEYQAELTAAKAALEELTAASAASAPALEKQAIATEAASAATTRLGVSARQGATTGIGMLEGRMMSGNRAAAAFLSTTLGLGPALQMAFPVIGLIALGEVAGRVGKMLYDAFDMGGERARKTAEDIQEVTNSLRMMNDEINVEIDRLTVANEKLEHKPTNGMKLAIDEAILDADRLDQKLDGVLKKIETAIKGMSGSFLQQVVGQQGGTGYEQTMASEHERHLSEQVNTQGELNESTSYYNSLLIRQKELKGWINDTGTSPATTPAYQTELDAVQRLMNAQAQEQQYIKATMDLQGAQTEHQTLVDAHSPKEKESPEVKDQFRIRKKELEDYGRSVEEETKTQEEILNHSMDWQLEEQKFATTQEIADANTVMVTRIDAVKKTEEADRQAAEEWKRTHEEQMRMMQEQTEATLKAIAAADEAQKRQIDHQEKMGKITPQAAAQQKIDMSNVQQAAQVNTLGDQLNATDRVTEPVQYKKIQDEITAAQRKGAAEREQITQQEAEREMQTYMKYAEQTNQALIGGLNEWMTTHKKFTDAMIDAGKHWAVSMIDDIAQVLLKKLELWALEKIMGSGSSESGFTKSTISQNLSVAESATATAAAIAFMENAGAGIGAAVAAAAEMYAAGAPFMLAAGMETGGIVPGRNGQGVPILAHAGEAVLPAPMTSMLMNAAGNGGGGGGHTFNTHSTINATVMDSKGLEGLARRSADANALHLKRAARRMNVTM